ncbi:hypothetical protein AB6A40_002934 [Gnathostoma spinigerum]|uniref:ELMO domain-containing protein n=1 Tax=Gnathostoma spinigerum TaxID=75299 RepID=A0ABD6E983_9BILA
MSSSSSFHTAAKPLKCVDTRIPENIVKGAVKLDPEISKYLDADLSISAASSLPYTYVTFDKQNEVLSDLITRLSVELKLPQKNKNLYALKFEKNDNDGAFLTKQNQSLVKQGFFLRLTASPERYANYFYSKLKADSQYMQEKQNILHELVLSCSDPVFADEFWKAGGFSELLSMIESGLYSDNVQSQSPLLQSLLLLMDHNGPMQWADVSDGFIRKISENITGKAKQEDNGLLLSSINIIDLVLNSKSETKMQTVMSEVRFETLIRHLEKSDERIIASVLTLMNSLYSKSEAEEKRLIIQHLHSTPFRHAVDNSVLRKPRKLDLGIEQQLITIQRIQLNQLALKAKRSPSDAEIERIMQTKVLNSDGGRHQHSLRSSSPTYLESRRNDWKNFVISVKNTPPGSLVTEAISDLAQIYPDTIAKINMENSLRATNEQWSLLMISPRLVEILIDLLHILSEPDDGDRLCVIFFKSDRPFLDLFANFVRLFHRTWREMHANVEDIEKVLSVVRQQLEICLKERPESMEKLEELLLFHSYPHMQKLWERQRSAQEAEELKSDTAREMREFLRPGIVALVKKNRKNALKDGQKFDKLVKSKSIQKAQQCWYWKLAANEKDLICTDCSSFEDTLALDADSTMKICISDIRRVEAGGGLLDVGNTPFKNKKHAMMRGITIEVGDKPEIYHLITSDERVIETWIDGLNALIGCDDLSLRAQQQVDRLLSIELKMRLLHIDHIPASVPLPPLPTDFSWLPKSASNKRRTLTSTISSP